MALHAGRPPYMDVDGQVGQQLEEGPYGPLHALSKKSTLSRRSYLEREREGSASSSWLMRIIRALTMMAL